VLKWLPGLRVVHARINVVHPKHVKGWERGAELIFALRADDPGP